MDPTAKYEELLRALLRRESSKRLRSPRRGGFQKCLTEEVIASYVEDLLSKEKREDVERHLSVCDECRKQSVMVNEVRAAMTSGELEVEPVALAEKARDLMPREKRMGVIEMIVELTGKTFRLVSESLSGQVLDKFGFMNVEDGAETVGLMCESPHALYESFSDLDGPINECRSPVEPQPFRRKEVVRRQYDIDRVMVQVELTKTGPHECALLIEVVDTIKRSPLRGIVAELVSDAGYQVSRKSIRGGMAFEALPAGVYIVRLTKQKQNFAEIRMTLT
ncbi:MAG: anti-sigma factor family protein [bacterium]